MTGVEQAWDVAALPQWGQPRGGGSAQVGKIGREGEERDNGRSGSSTVDAQQSSNGDRKPWHGNGHAEMCTDPSSFFEVMAGDSARDSISRFGSGNSSDLDSAPDIMGFAAQHTNIHNSNTFNALNGTVSAEGGDGFGGVHDQLIKQADELVANGCQVKSPLLWLQFFLSLPGVRECTPI